MRAIRLLAVLAFTGGCTTETVLTITCPVGAAYCSNACSNLSTDASNCGACGNACDAGLSCVAGACTDAVSACDPGLTSCGGDCVDVLTDRDDCGSCGHVCSIHAACIDGACALQCQADLTLCGTACVNLGTDDANCGACGSACPVGSGCVAGACTAGAGCGTGLTSCGGICVDIVTDPDHCGACGNACAVGSTCEGGSCATTCTGGLSACGAACVDLSTDSANCGACGAACGAGETCASGSCSCPSGLSSCGADGCVDLTLDPQNCGACGASCGNGEVCSGGACACAPGSEVCGTSPACIDLATDGDNCGACLAACPVGQTCVAGSCAADASAFRMLGGDAGHSGFNPGELGTPPLSKAWEVVGAGGGSPPVIEGGRVLSIGAKRLYAIEASTGAEIWSYNFGTPFGVGWPAVSGGDVFVATSNNYGDTWLRRFDRATGALGFKVPFGSQWERYWSPIVVDGSVYLNGGSYGGLYGFSAATGTQLFFGSLEQYDEWSPAYFGGKVYTFVEGMIRAHDPVSGAILASKDVGWSWAGWSMWTAPAFGDSYGYVISPPDLYAFAPDTLNVVWTVNGSYVSYPAVAGGVVYALGSGILHAVDAATGASKWVFAGDDALSYPPVIAGGHVYVSSNSNVYAVNIATHAQVWTAPVGGRLAIGSGMLVVSSPSGSLVGFKLAK